MPEFGCTLVHSMHTCGVGLVFGGSRDTCAARLLIIDNCLIGALYVQGHLGR